MPFRDHFYQYGEIRQIHMVPQKFCAFIQYTTRQAAELAAERTFEQLLLKVPSLNTSQFTYLAGLEPKNQSPLGSTALAKQPSPAGAQRQPGSGAQLGKPYVLETSDDLPRKCVIVGFSLPKT